MVAATQKGRRLYGRCRYTYDILFAISRAHIREASRSDRHNKRPQSRYVYMMNICLAVVYDDGARRPLPQAQIASSPCCPLIAHEAVVVRYSAIHYTANEEETELHI